MKSILNYLGAIIVLVAAVVLVFIYLGGKGNNTSYGITLLTMFVGLVLQTVMGRFIKE